MFTKRSLQLPCGRVERGDLDATEDGGIFGSGCDPLPSFGYRRPREAEHEDARRQQFVLLKQIGNASTRDSGLSCSWWCNDQGASVRPQFDQCLLRGGPDLEALGDGRRRSDNMSGEDRLVVGGT